jgi:hypothetical protein
MFRSLLPTRILPSERRVVEVGWLLFANQWSMIFDTPRPLFRKDAPPQHAKSASFCPAIIDHESRIFEVTCPYDLQLGCRLDGERFVVWDLSKDMSAVQSDDLKRVLKISGRKVWRHPDRPILQLTAPYMFVADEPVYITQMPAFGFYRDPPYPGTVVPGRFPVHIWTRALIWAFEWYDTKKPLILRRGEPWFYVRFETFDPSRPVRLVEAEMTPELREYANAINGVTHFVRRTFSLFDTARSRRPRKLLVKRDSNSPANL